MSRSPPLKRIVHRIMTSLFTFLEVLGLPPVPGRKGGKEAEQP